MVVGLGGGIGFDSQRRRNIKRVRSVTHRVDLDLDLDLDLKEHNSANRQGLSPKPTG